MKSGFPLPGSAAVDIDYFFVVAPRNEMLAAEAAGSCSDKIFFHDFYLPEFFSRTKRPFFRLANFDSKHFTSFRLAGFFLADLSPQAPNC